MPAELIRFGRVSADESQRLGKSSCNLFLIYQPTLLSLLPPELLLSPELFDSRDSVFLISLSESTENETHSSTLTRNYIRPKDQTHASASSSDTCPRPDGLLTRLNKALRTSGSMNSGILDNGGCRM